MKEKIKKKVKEFIEDERGDVRIVSMLTMSMVVVGGVARAVLAPESCPWSDQWNNWSDSGHDDSWADGWASWSDTEWSDDGVWIDGYSDWSNTGWMDDGLWNNNWADNYDVWSDTGWTDDEPWNNIWENSTWSDTPWSNWSDTPWSNWSDTGPY